MPPFHATSLIARWTIPSWPMLKPIEKALYKANYFEVKPLIFFSFLSFFHFDLVIFPFFSSFVVRWKSLWKRKKRNSDLVLILQQMIRTCTWLVVWTKKKKENIFCFLGSIFFFPRSHKLVLKRCKKRILGKRRWLLTFFFSFLGHEFDSLKLVFVDLRYVHHFIHLFSDSVAHLATLLLILFVFRPVNCRQTQLVEVTRKTQVVTVVNSLGWLMPALRSALTTTKVRRFGWWAVNYGGCFDHLSVPRVPNCSASSKLRVIGEFVESKRHAKRFAVVCW